LSSQVDASKAIVKARRSAGRSGREEEEDTSVRTAVDEDSDSSDVETLRTSVEGPTHDHDHVYHEVDAPPGSPEGETFQIKTGKERDSIAEDVMGRKGRYGRFASNWFSKTGWSAGKRSSQGMSSTEPSEVSSLAPVTAAAPTTATTIDAGDGVGVVSPATGLGTSSSNQKKDINEQTSKLMPKLLRHTKMFFGGRHFYMSYDYDITRRFGVDDPGKAYLPLHRVVDPLVRKESGFTFSQ
jgi:hypothetical protein